MTQEQEDVSLLHQVLGDVRHAKCFWDEFCVTVILFSAKKNVVFREERVEVVLLVVPHPSNEPPRGDKIPPKQLKGMMQRFSDGRWFELVVEETCRIARTAGAREARFRPRHESCEDESLVIDELSSARQVLESADLAPDNLH